MRVFYDVSPRFIAEYTAGLSIVLRIFIAVVACFGLWVVNAPAQTYPVKPIRLLFGYTAGGAGDGGARLLAQKLSENLGQNVVV